MRRFSLFTLCNVRTRKCGLMSFFPSALPLCLLLAYHTGVQAQHTTVYAPGIYTVQMIANNDYQLPPVITLGKEESIELSFDRLTHEYRRLHYTLTHCNADYKPSGLSVTEYMDGFEENLIEDYAVSLSTTLPYTHYRLTIPNENLSLKLSGNYRLAVFDETGNNILPVLEAFFQVLEPHVDISAQISGDTDIDRNRSHQQVRLSINHKGYTIRNPRQELKVYVSQNKFFHSPGKNELQPDYIGAYEVHYRHNPSLIFPAGNEFRRFEIVSTRYAGMGVNNILYQTPYYHVTLYPDEPRVHRYHYDEDRNGRFLIRNSEVENARTEADYFLVHFTFNPKDTFLPGKLYLQGDFTYNKLNETYRMTYNSEKKHYETALLLKQGAYNYRYVYTDPDATHISWNLTEGNFYETENEYLILVYHCPPGERYDKLIGMKWLTYPALR